MQTVIIKVSTPWDHIDFEKRVPELAGYKFVFDAAITECDYWIVWGGIKTNAEKVICDPANIIYLTDEVHEERFFNKNFLDQFAAIITCRTDINHQRVVATHELNTWLIDRSYAELYNTPVIPKTKMLSVISSDQTWLPGHKLRYAFVNKLIGHFKDKLDVFGKGFNTIPDKYDGLASYKYSVAIENSAIPGYFTEKITDCYLAHTMPLYYGCPDIDKYFDSRSMLLLDPNNYKASITGIEQLVDEDPYETLLPVIQMQSRKYLEEYNIFNKLVRILETSFSRGTKKTKCTIHSELSYYKGYKLNNFIGAAFKTLHLPGKLFFQVKPDQSSTYANPKRKSGE